MVGERDSSHVRVRCYVRLPVESRVRPGARVRVAIEEVSLADAPAHLVATADFPTPSSERMLGPFEVDADLAPSGAEYALRVHVDQIGDGQVVPGDLVSTIRHTVSASTSMHELEVPVAVVPETP
jgi:uncharacterized lipoprotein YbaY